MLCDIDETPGNVCGVIGGHFLILAPVEEAVEREFINLHLFDEEQKGKQHKPLYGMISRASENSGAVHMSIRVLETVKGKSVHFPELIERGRINTLCFGSEGEQELERDPGYYGYPYAIVQYDAMPLSTLPFLSPERTVPSVLALMVGLGCIRALAALNRAGFVHRFVTPYNFAITNPPTKENILNKIIITDFSGVLPWPCKPRKFVPFIGTYRYSSVRAHWGREQGPSDDVISVIFMVAELLHGKLPWRSMGNELDEICYYKVHFYESTAFKKLPRELRQIYSKMYSKTGAAAVDFQSVVDLFKKAISQRDKNDSYKIPNWLLVELDEE